jgi:hypothetical protein
MRSKIGVLALTALSACYEADPMFYGNCEQISCGWQVESGTLEQLGSWHEQELAYRLTGMPGRITRLAPNALAGTPCLVIDMTTKVAEDAALQLLLDFGNDGKIERMEPIAPHDWRRSQIFVRTPQNFRTLRMRFDKQGAGDAEFNYLNVRQAPYGCPADEPALTLQSGSVCSIDANCQSGRCVLGQCSPCGAGGCPEGAPCRANDECIDGACAGNVCRACAARNACGVGEACSTPAQCASGSCVPGARPSLVTRPELDSFCGECSSASQCASNRCIAGRCADCETDGDCRAGQSCRFDDQYEAVRRTCVTQPSSPLARGALCEADAECADGLRCGGGVGRPKRCGVSCATAGDCNAGELCATPGAVRFATEPASYELLPQYRELTARINTCWPLSNNGDCAIHAQCLGNACCEGRCEANRLDYESGMCRHL